MLLTFHLVISQFIEKEKVLVATTFYVTLLCFFLPAEQVHWTKRELCVDPPQEGVTLQEQCLKERNDMKKRVVATPTCTKGVNWARALHLQACPVDQNVFSSWYGLGPSKHAQNLNLRGKVGT